MHYCTVMSCGAPTSGHSTYCDRHKRAQRRHGHPEQSGVTVHVLRPYKARVAARRLKNPESPVWPLLEQRWQALRDATAATLASFHRGSPEVGYEITAAEQVRVVGEAVPVDEVIDTALAMYLLLDERPHAFKSDRAFRFELARRVRSLTEKNAGSYWDAKAGKAKRVYRDTTPRALDLFAGWLVTVFGATGVVLAGLEKQDAAKVQEDRQRFADALGGLK